MQTTNVLHSNVSNSIKQSVIDLKQELNLITPFITDTLEVTLRENSKVKDGLVFQFSVNEVTRFIERITEDLYFEEKKLLERLDIGERTKRIPRLEKHAGIFSVNELTNTLLHLKQEHNYDLDSAYILMPESVYENMKWQESDRVTTIDGLVHFYNIPVYSDINWPLKFKCLPNRIICFGDSKQKLKVYKDSINISSSGIEYYRIVLPLFTPYKLLTIKV